MSAYEYDGSFEGLLCAFHSALENQCETALFEGNPAGSSAWLFDSFTIQTNPEIADRFCKSLQCVGGPDTLQCAAYAFLSEIPGIEAALYNMIRLTLDHRRSVTAWMHHPAVKTVQSAVRRVTFENHRLCGMLRFVKLRDLSFYAPYAPDHNITLLLARHFKTRMPYDHWIIHDKRRELAVAWDGHSLLTRVGVPYPMENLMADDEHDYQELWRLFTKTIAIPERFNPRLQRQFMPQRYWPYLTEKQ